MEDISDSNGTFQQQQRQLRLVNQGCRCGETFLEKVLKAEWEETPPNIELKVEGNLRSDGI